MTTEEDMKRTETTVGDVITRENFEKARELYTKLDEQLPDELQFGELLMLTVFMWVSFNVSRQDFEAGSEIIAYGIEFFGQKVAENAEDAA